MSARDKIIEIISTEDGVSAKTLKDRLSISKQRVHVLLRELVTADKIYKQGKPPRVFYHLKTIASPEELNIADASEDLLQKKFLLIDPRGNLATGIQGFARWCEQRNLPVLKTLEEYVKTLDKYKVYYDEDGIIDGTNKLKNTKELKLCIDQQFYVDFYAIERFGKTKLGSLLHFGKMSQSKKLIKEIIDLSKEKLETLIKKMKIDAVAYIPPTLKREVQIMRELELGFNVSKPIIGLEKVSGEIIIPQKALSKIKDRIENAQVSILVTDRRKFENILLIDDALGSGATINEVACKLKKYGLAKKVYGFAITGSFKGFEVLSEA